MKMAQFMQNLFYPLMVGILLFGWSSHRTENRQVLDALNKTNQTLALVLEQLKNLKEVSIRHADEIKQHSRNIAENKTAIEFLKK